MGRLTDTRYGAVLVFRDTMSKEQCQKTIDTLIQTGVLDPDYKTKLNEFSPEYGRPVWYVP